MALAMAASEDWEVLVLDVQTAFHRGTGGICEDFSIQAKNHSTLQLDVPT